MIFRFDEMEWRAVPGFEDIYEVSDTGLVKRFAGVAKNRNGFYRLPERLIPPIITGGYCVLDLWRTNRRVRFFVHRLVMLCFVGDSELSVDHLNGNKTDNRLVNLQYCSRAENTRRQHRDGRTVFVRGERNGKSKLTEKHVSEIKRRLARGEGATVIAESMFVSKGAIQAIKEGRSWKHVV